MFVFSFINSLMLKKVFLLVLLLFEIVGEFGVLLVVELWKKFKELKLQKEEFDGDVDCLLGF